MIENHDGKRDYLAYLVLDSIRKQLIMGGIYESF
jgi:hypothetical protein